MLVGESVCFPEVPGCKWCGEFPESAGVGFGFVFGDLVAGAIRQAKVAEIVAITPGITALNHLEVFVFSVVENSSDRAAIQVEPGKV